MYSLSKQLRLGCINVPNNEALVDGQLKHFRVSEKSLGIDKTKLTEVLVPKIQHLVQSWIGNEQGFPHGHLS